MDYTDSATRIFWPGADRDRKEAGAAYLRMELNVPRIEHEKDGQVKQGGFNHVNMSWIGWKNAATGISATPMVTAATGCRALRTA